jgi:DNA ligase-1
MFTQQLSLDNAILDGETIATGSKGTPLPFQVTMRRFGRVSNVANTQKKIPLTTLLFDILYLDGDALFQVPYGERFALLIRRVKADNVIPQIVTSDQNIAGEFLNQSLRAGHEGVMAKDPKSPYVAGQRGFHWLKIKPVKTLDLVVLAAEWGSGRRAGWLSNLHLGALNPESGRFVMLGKTFKGLTDRMLRWMTRRLLTLETDRDETTVYVAPRLVVEIAYSGLQESSRYPGGLALRFARVRCFREDKSPLEADSIQTVWAHFRESMRT